jgi:hypothetical protein
MLGNHRHQTAITVFAVTKRRKTAHFARQIHRHQTVITVVRITHRYQTVKLDGRRRGHRYQTVKLATIPPGMCSVRD